MNRQIAYVASATGTPDSGAGRNRYVFPGMLCVSILLHALLLVMMSDHIDSRETSVIELTLESVDKTPGRSLPRPHFRPKNPVLPQELVHQKVVVRREPLQNPCILSSRTLSFRKIWWQKLMYLMFRKHSLRPPRILQPVTAAPGAADNSGRRRTTLI